MNSIKQVILFFMPIFFINAFCLNNKIEKVLLHKGSGNFYKKSNDKDGGFTFRDSEIGNIVFYFSKKPIMRIISNNSNTLQSKDNVCKSFMFPQTDMQNIKGKHDIKQWDLDFYKVKIERVVTPIEGVMLSVSYNSNDVFFYYRCFKAIGNRKGLIFRFYNKKHIDKFGRKIIQIPTALKILPESEKKSIIIDCGHGGADSGAVGAQGIREKDVTLAIGLYLKDMLVKKEFDVFLSRSFDKTVDLDERTSFANRYNKADFFISLHANSTYDKNILGVETFCLCNTLFSNFASTDLFNVPKEVNACLAKRYEKSFSLAINVQKHVCSIAKKYNENTIDRGVKYFAYQLLLGVTMPAVLIEVGFLSNRSEEILLKKGDYQKAIAKGLYNGIIAYFE